MSTRRDDDPDGRPARSPEGGAHDRPSNAPVYSYPPRAGFMGSPAGVGWGRSDLSRPWAHATNEPVEVKLLRLAQLETAMRQIVEGPLGVAVVVSVSGERALLSLGAGGLVQVARHPEAAAGDQVLVSRDTMAIVSVDRGAPKLGCVVAVLVVYPDRDLAEVEYAQMRRLVRTLGRVAVGERLVVDPNLLYQVGTLGLPTPAHAPPEVSVPWDDVGGHEEAKEQLREAVELPFEHPQLYAAYGKRPPKGVLLFGPPGTGKTLLARAVATAVARVHGRAEVAAGGFRHLKGPELLSRWLGDSEGGVRQMFREAREFRDRHGYPAVIFLDEADALLGSRDQSMNVTINVTLVPQFLAEMDGFEASEVVLLLATNRPDRLDAAVVREGRIDRKVYVGRPSEADAVQILGIHLRGRPVADGVAVSDLASEVARVVFSPGGLVVEDYRDTGGPLLELRHLVSGAMLLAIVDRATTIALRRDAADGHRDPGGVRLSDLVDAVERTRVEQRGLDHSEVLGGLVRPGGGPGGQTDRGGAWSRSVSIDPTIRRESR
jgi:proteasome-associated ATPase